MATWTFDRPAGTFSAQDDTDLATETYALTNSPGDFAVSVSAVNIAAEVGAVDVAPGGGNDDYGLNVRIMSGATVLAAATSGGAYETVQAIAASGTYPKDFPAISFTYVLTTATQAQWDAAVIEYQQTYFKNGGPDRDYITVAAGTNDITVTYTADVAPTLELPTEADLTATTATVGCSTNFATGDLYWFVSTSATAPTAANLKAGTGAFNGQFGSVASPGIGTETFSVSGLTQSGTYYTYFVHTNTVGDSNILESGSWLTQSAITADDLESASEVTRPVIEQIHALLADDLESNSILTRPVFDQLHIIAADDLESEPEVNRPVVVEDTQNELLADDLESASQVSAPVIEQIHALLADDLEGASQLDTPVFGQLHIIAADDLESEPEVDKPTLVSLASVTDIFADDLESGVELGTPAVSENVEYLRPDGDNAVGSWTTGLGGATNLYQEIDETVASDSDYIRSEVNPSTSAYRVNLSDPVLFPNPSGANVIRYRYRKGDENGQTLSLTVRLIEGASTVIATWSHPDVSNVISQAEQVLDAGQKSSIGNYSNLSLEFEADGA